MEIIIKNLTWLFDALLGLTIERNTICNIIHLSPTHTLLDLLMSCPIPS